MPSSRRSKFRSPMVPSTPIIASISTISSCCHSRPSTMSQASSAPRIHECAHASGAKHQLDCDFVARFASEARSIEEITAELTAGFILANLGIAHHPRADHASLPIRLSPTATSGSVRPCSWTFTSVAIFGSHNRCQSSSDFSLTMRPVPATWRRLAGATGSFAPIVRRRESRSAWQIVLASCAAASAAVTPH